MSDEKEDAARRAAFARALARSVFGRNYWDDEREEERRAGAAKKKPADGGPAKVNRNP